MNGKFIYTSGLFLLFSFTLQAQNKPGGAARPAATPQTVPAPYTASSINYVRTWEPDMPLTDTAAVISSAKKVREVKQTTQYVDGLGRPLQTVSKGISSSGKDVVAPVIYDAYGREQYKYLPYVQQSGNMNDGKFKTDPFNSQKAFYQNGVLNPGIIGEDIYYSRQEFEQSPLNRPLKGYAPGDSWASRPVENRYQVNAVSDSVRLWSMGSVVPASSSNYEAGQLVKNVTVDEHGSQVIEYKDKQDQVVLKKVQVSNNPGTGHIGWLCTYYVYDDLGNLRFVIPPLAVEAIKGTWAISAAIANELCFQYQYDTRQRMIVKQVPGAGRVFMVYDVRDRLVFTQDSVQRVKSTMEWLVTFYDELNRPTMTAIYKGAATRDTMQARMNRAPVSQSVSYVAPAKADLALYAHDGSPLYTATNSISMLDGFDTGVGGETEAKIDAAAAGDTTVITASNPLPNIPATALTPLTYTFYDKYDYTGKLAFIATDTGKLLAADTLYPEKLPISNMTTGLVTGSKVRVLGTDKWLTTTTYYNDKGRAIQVISENNLGGKDITTTLYSFKGAVLASYLRHQNPESIMPQTTILTSMSYDHGGRLLSVRKRLNDNVSQEKIIASNSYDELGQLRLKRLGVTSSGSLIDTLNYTYNIRGWLQGINKNFVNSGNSTSNWFGQELSYDYGFDSSQYNGNISGVKWKTRADSAWAYGYSYDKTNRLTGAYFTQKNGGSWAQDKKNFSVSNLSYDANGNIKTMLQKGMVGTASKTIDSLVYSYSANSNKLSGVRDIDSSITKSAMLGDFIDGNTGATDYTYDGNGNMVADLNKNISSITYNHLNLPSVITVTGKGTITYQYDAAGNKLTKTVVDNTGSTPKTTVTDYAGAFIYRQDSLELISHEEGRIRPVYKSGQPVQYAYDYFEKDHLGNVRTVLTDQTDFTMYAATMETETAAQEVALFSNIEDTRAERPSGYPEDQTTEENKFVAKLNAKEGGKKIGPSLVLRVMAGDTIQINAKVFYKSQGPTDDSQKAPVEDMVAGLVQAFGGKGAEDGSHASEAVANNTPFNSDFYNNNYQRLKEKNQENGQSDRPKAYLNFVLFDDDFKLVEDNSGVRQVKASPDELQELGVEKMAVEESGFLYVYTSNESQQDVFFDNVVLRVASGPLLGETHYYPYGLTMAGISTSALKGANYAKNQKEYNGIEHTTDLDLNQYDALFRTLDPQIGRWTQIDPRPDQSLSPYTAMGNNPIFNVDFRGDTIRGYSERSAQRLLEGIHGSFAGNSKMQSLFQIGKDGVTLNSISINAFIDASSGLNTDQLTLAAAYFMGVNQDATHVVSVLKLGEIAEPGTSQFLGEETANMFDFYGGGAINWDDGPKRTFTGIVMDAKSTVDNDYMQGGKYIKRGSSFGEKIAHEVLGHGVASVLGQSGWNLEEGIQMSNVYLRAHKETQGIYRDGGSHFKNRHLESKVANDIPDYYKGAQGVLRLMKLLR
jgi:RHS repeat-associated protein